MMTILNLYTKRGESRRKRVRSSIKREKKPIPKCVLRKEPSITCLNVLLSPTSPLSLTSRHIPTSFLLSNYGIRDNIWSTTFFSTCLVCVLAFLFSKMFCVEKESQLDFGVRSGYTVLCVRAHTHTVAVLNNYSWAISYTITFHSEEHKRKHLQRK